MSTLSSVVILDSVYSLSGVQTRQVVESRAHGTIFLSACLLIASQ
jgi:hypothetical protein